MVLDDAKEDMGSLRVRAGRYDRACVSTGSRGWARQVGSEECRRAVSLGPERIHFSAERRRHALQFAPVFEHAFERQSDRSMPGRVVRAAGQARERQRANPRGHEANLHRRAQGLGRDAAPARPAARLADVQRARRQVGRHGGRLAPGRVGRERVLEQGAPPFSSSLPKSAALSFCSSRPQSRISPARAAPCRKSSSVRRAARRRPRGRGRARAERTSPPSRRRRSFSTASSGTAVVVRAAHGRTKRPADGGAYSRTLGGCCRTSAGRTPTMTRRVAPAARSCAPRAPFV